MPELKQPQQFSFVLEKPCEDSVAFLAAETGLSKAAIKSAMAKGALWYSSGHGYSGGHRHSGGSDYSGGQGNGDGHNKPKRLRRKSVRLKAGTELYLYFDPQLLNQQPLEPKLVEDCGGFSVWDKPSGMSMLGSKWCDHTAFERWVEVNHLAGGQTYIVHRLDRWASGLVVLAHSKQVAAGLAELFAARQTHKQYLALADADIDVDSLLQRLPITLDTPVEGKISKSLVIDIKPATSLLNTRDQQKIDAADLRGIFELRIAIETGRKHQIRQHCAGMDWPLLGDRLYADASTNSNLEVDLQLRSVCLGFHFESKEYLWELNVS